MRDYTITFHPSEIILYFRKSRQDDPTMTVAEVLAQHRRIADDWISNHLTGQVPTDNIYMERASGETIDDRPEFLKVLKAVESDRIKAVFVIEPQRLSRGDLADAGRLINIFRYTNTMVITPYRTYDLSDDGDRMIFEMELKQGNQYLEYTKALMKRGRQDAIKRGCYIPSCRPYGYKKVAVGKNKTLEIYEPEAEIVRMAFNMYDDGKSIIGIVNHLNDLGIKPMKSDHWSRSVIITMLRNPVYIGKITTGQFRMVVSVQNGVVTRKPEYKPRRRVIIDGLHENIISEEQFYRVQEKIGYHPNCKYDQKLRNPLAKIIFCKNCGHAFVLDGRRDRNLRMTCANRKICRTGSILLSYIYADIKATLEQEIENMSITINGSIDDLHEKWQTECDLVKSRLDALDDRELKMWKDRYETAIMPDRIFQQLTESISTERAKLKAALETLLSSEPSNTKIEERIIMLHDAINCFDADIDAQAKNDILRKVIKRIEVSRPFVSHSSYMSYSLKPYTIDITLQF